MLVTGHKVLHEYFQVLAHKQGLAERWPIYIAGELCIFVYFQRTELSGVHMIKTPLGLRVREAGAGVGCLGSLTFSALGLENHGRFLVSWLLCQHSLCLPRFL